jgi:hypothetical protein
MLDGVGKQKQLHGWVRYAYNIGQNKVCTLQGRVPEREKKSDAVLRLAAFFNQYNIDHYRDTDCAYLY